ncbi:response regulator transcription factor [Candidatus Binatia bacterium]|nr:response regulator transcription factor [Candidatus Binatia bacterium]
MRVLVVEDEPKVASFLQRGLAAEGYAVDVAADGHAALSAAGAGSHDVLVVDIMLPGLDGIALTRALRERGCRVPILLLTARDTLADKVAGLDSGADDYLTKPFAFEELLARVRALLRRTSPPAPAVMTVADLRLDPVRREVTRSGRRIELSPREFALLEFFLRRPGQVLSRAVIAQHVWGVDFDTFTNVIDVYVNYLRKKVDADFDRKLLHTVRGVGYVLKDSGQ